MSKLEDIEKDIARLTVEAKFSAWLDQLEGQLRAAGIAPRAVPAASPAGAGMTAAATPGAAAAGPSQVISFRRDPRRFRRDRGW